MLFVFYCSSFILLFLIWFIPRYIWYRRTKKLMDLLPGPNVKSVVGDVKLLMMQNSEMSTVTSNYFRAMSRMHQKEGLYAIWAFYRPIVGVYQPDVIEAILSSSSLITKSYHYDLLGSWLGSGLITNTGSEWKRHRKILTPAFHFRILEEFVPTVNEQAQILVNNFEKRLDDPWIELLPFITKCALDIICETSMGIQLGSQNDEEPEYLIALQCLQESFIWRSAFPWLEINLIFYATPMGRSYLKSLRKVQTFTKQVIKQRKTEILNNESKFQELMEIATADDTNSNSFQKPKARLAFLDLLLYYHIRDGSLTEQQVLDEVNTFMFAGHDTTSHAITWTLYLLGLHPKIQEKVQAELDEIFADDRQRPATSDDLKMMKYLECVIKESQRLYPPVPMIARNLTDDVKVNGYTIPKDVSCIMLLYTLHKDKNLFPKPHHFVPERFLPENSKGRHPFAFVPFSAGPRNCIGQRFAMNEEKILLSAVLRNFTITSLDEQDKLTVDANIILKPTCPIRIKLSKRAPH